MKLLTLFGVKFVIENRREIFKFESVRLDLVMLLVNFMDENACWHMYIIPKQHITLSAFS